MTSWRDFGGCSNKEFAESARKCLPQSPRTDKVGIITVDVTRELLMGARLMLVTNLRMRFRHLSVTVAVTMLSASFGFAQLPATSPYRPVEPIVMPLDRDGVYTFHFAYTPPRIITVDVPGKGPRTVWYMVYQVWNKSDTPQEFKPEFELVTKDGQLRSYLDEPYPTIAKQAIAKIEDPTGELKLQTSNSIGMTKIPVTKPDSVPRAVYGVAVWLDAPDKSSNTNNFSIYVTGLSNGNAVQEADGGVRSISRKTLQIDFTRPTDNVRPMQNDIRPNDNNGLGSEKWIYRVIPVAKQSTPPAVEKKDN